jgi:hypothetical protein
MQNAVCLLLACWATQLLWLSWEAGKDLRLARARGR